MKKLKKQKGITLIALVVTIIVLLILAGVSLSLIAGSNGIISKAEKSADVTKDAKLEEEIQLKVAEVATDFYIDPDTEATNVGDYIKEKCEEGGGDYVVGDGKFSYDEEDDTLSYTDSEGNKAIITIDENGKVTIEGTVSPDGSIKNDKAAPIIAFTAKSHSITFVAKDAVSGVVAWAFTETPEEPTSWNEIPNQKVFRQTMTDLNMETTYYIWAKDANGNVTKPPKSAKTLLLETVKISYVWTDDGKATITVDNYTDEFTYTYSTDGGTTWTDYSESTKPVIPSGTKLIFKVSDGEYEKSTELINVLKESTVTYNANGGTGSVPTSLTKVAHGTKVAVDTTAILSREHYTFLGWALTKDATETISIFDMPANDVTLYAVWSGDPHSITYNANGGTGVPSNQAGKYGDTVAINFSTVPTKTGYTFLGYATTEDATNANYSSSGTNTLTLTGDVTLYAVWNIATYTVTYNANEGTGSVPSAQTAVYNTQITVSFSPVPSREGYEFLGWSTISNATSATYTSEGTQTITLTEDITLYAVWKQGPQPAISAIQYNNYGDLVEYSANGITDWKIFINGGTNIGIISSEYVPRNLLTLGSNVNAAAGAYGVKGIQAYLYSWLTNTGYWTNFVDPSLAVSATGAPTLSLFYSSVNGKYGTNYSAAVQSFSGTVVYNDPLYFPHKSPWNSCNAYWLAYKRCEL